MEQSLPYKKVEKIAQKRILGTLPQEIANEFMPLLQIDGEEKKLVKYADKLTAYIKCVEEVNCNNAEFISAKNSIEKELRGYKSKSVDYFMDTFIEAFRLSLDDLSISNLD